MPEINDTTNFIAEVAAPADPNNIGAIRTDEREEVKWKFQQMLNEFAITHERRGWISPLQYNGDAERALDVLKEKKMAMLEDLTKGGSYKLTAEAMSMACGMSNVCVTTANKGGTLPYEKWQETPLTVGEVQPFGHRQILGAPRHEATSWIRGD